MCDIIEHVTYIYIYTHTHIHTHIYHEKQEVQNNRSEFPCTVWCFSFSVSLIYMVLLNEFALLLEQSLSIKKKGHLKTKTNYHYL
jgi:hypothetical protein